MKTITRKWTAKYQQFDSKTEQWVNVVKEMSKEYPVIEFHGEDLIDDAPEYYGEDMGRTYYQGDLEEYNDDIGYFYSDQDGGEGRFYSLVSGDFV
jgi:hypothetical protein